MGNGLYQQRAGLCPRFHQTSRCDYQRGWLWPAFGPPHAGVRHPTVGFQWYFGGTAPANALPGQTASTLSIASPTFADGGNYYCVATNYLGGATSAVVAVTIEAAASELYPTGVDTNGQLMASPANNPDPHWTLIQSSDPNHLGPDLLVWDTNQCPVVKRR